MFSNPADLTKQWGLPVWQGTSPAYRSGWPEKDGYDIAVIGAGFTGLSCALHVIAASPGASVVLLEAGEVGNGASRRSGGMVLDHTAGGPHPDFENCIDYFENFINSRGISCGFRRTGCFEVARTGGESSSPIAWEDSGTVKVSRRIGGGTVDPAKLLYGLADSAGMKKIEIRTNAPVREIEPGSGSVVVSGMQHSLHASAVILATNAISLGLPGVEGTISPCMTLAIAASGVDRAAAQRAGWPDKTPFFTTDFPYLWGRDGLNDGIVMGAGLVFEGEAESIDAGYVQEQFRSLESRIRSMHPAFGAMNVTHRWAGPIALTSDMKPLIRVIEDKKIVYAGAYAGHGVAQSIKAGALVAKLLGM